MTSDNATGDGGVIEWDNISWLAYRPACQTQLGRIASFSNRTLNG